MNSAMYLSLATLVEPYLARSRPFFETPSETCVVASKAVYVACGYTGVVFWVGSAVRGARAVQSRMAEHLRQPYSVGWTHLWVFPMVDATPVWHVKSVEGMIGRILRPVLTRRLPSMRY